MLFRGSLPHMPWLSWPVGHECCLVSLPHMPWWKQSATYALVETVGLIRPPHGGSPIMGRSMHRAEEACKKATYAPRMGEAPLRGYAVIYICSLQDATQKACNVPKKHARRQHMPPHGEAPLRGSAVIYIFYYRTPNRKQAVGQRNM